MWVNAEVTTGKSLEVLWTPKNALVAEGSTFVSAPLLKLPGHLLLPDTGLPSPCSVPVHPGTFRQGYSEWAILRYRNHDFMMTKSAKCPKCVVVLGEVYSDPGKTGSPSELGLELFNIL